jgi:hypothetical protein
MSRQRLHQALLITTFIAFSWLAFMVVHEFGHVLTAWLSGGTVSRVVLHPLQISWTALRKNPNPQLVAWGGPILGCLLPLGILGVAVWLRLPGIYLVRFFGGFCIIANGLYLLVDAFEKGGDGGTLLRHGAGQWQLLAFSAIATPSGFWLWHGLGRSFGLGSANGRVDSGAIVCSVCLLTVVVVLELIFYSHGI